MNLMRQYLILIIFVLTAPTAWAEDKGLSFESVYTLDFFANTAGGIKRDHTYLDNLDLSLNIDTEKVGWWENGNFFIYALSNSGNEKLSGSIVGDTQTVSNIEAPRTIRLFELWYEHFLSDRKTSVLMGFHDYNSEFNVAEYGGLFINSSFGVPANISKGARPSIFSLAAPAIRLKTQPSQNTELLLGIYDGDPDNPEDNEHFPRSDFDSSGGAFITGEFIYRSGVSTSSTFLPGTYKIGGWTNTGDFNDLIDKDENDLPLSRTGNFGGYLVIDQMIFQETEEEGLATFLQISGSPDHLNEVDFYVGGGFHYRGLIPSRDYDECGVAIAYASISNELVDVGGRDNFESALEFTYKAQINDSLNIQPDLQYVINPGASTQGGSASGGNPALKNATILGIRFEISL